MTKRKRFLDDLWFLWHGSERQFGTFKQLFNDLGKADNFTVKGGVGFEIDFLDVKMMLVNGDIQTSVFIKPTDSQRYLNRRSDHSLHVFKGIPFSQFRRAVVICSDNDSRNRCIDHMYKKFVSSGYSNEELDKCKTKALALNRDEIIENHLQKNENDDENSILTFVINHDPQMSVHIKSFLKKETDTLKKLIGDKRIIISERRSANTASLTFAKSSFSTTAKIFKSTQKCGSARCKTCSIMNAPKNIRLNNFPLKLDFSLNCQTENCIYVALCKNCKALESFYIGKTINMARSRFNNHRSCFKSDSTLQVK